MEWWRWGGVGGGGEVTEGAGQNLDRILKFKSLRAALHTMKKLPQNSFSLSHI